jgi:hypothetical protein
MTIDEEFKYLPLELLAGIIDRIDDAKSLATAKNVNRTWHGEVIKNNRLKALLIDYIQTILMKNSKSNFKPGHLESKDHEFLIQMANVISKKTVHPNLEKMKFITKNIVNKQIIMLIVDQYLHRFSRGRINLGLVDRPNSAYFILFSFYLISTLLHYARTASPDKNFLISFIFTYELYVELTKKFIKQPFAFALPIILVGVLFVLQLYTAPMIEKTLHKIEITQRINAANHDVPISKVLASPTEIMTLAWRKSSPFSLATKSDLVGTEMGHLDSEITLSTKKNQ